MSRRYLTVSIPYVNADPHLGYALELVQADVLARVYRSRDDEVRFLGGTDDHALKNALAAEAAGVPTQAFVDANAARFEALQGPLGVRFDDFIRTSTDPRHRPTVEALWRLSAANGDFYRRTYEGRYCGGCEQFYAPDELDDGRCPEHETPADLVAEDNWFFRLSRYESQVEALLASGQVRIEPEAYAREALAFVRAGLSDISVSRSRSRARGWGIPVPDDPDQVIYVWWDALANYISALDFGGDRRSYDHWWVGSDERIHVIGKGILRFHAIYWPALLLSAGQPLPTTIFVHPYLTANGKKLSKSTGNVVDPVAVVEAYGTDAIRWWLVTEVPRSADADYTHARLVERHDTDLANGVGNLANRVLTMIHRFRGGICPTGTPSIEPTPEALEAADQFDLRRLAQAVVDEVNAANQLVETAKPWELAKQEREGSRSAGDSLDRCLGDLYAILNQITGRLRPLLPAIAEVLSAALHPDEANVLPPAAPLIQRLERPAEQATR